MWSLAELQRGSAFPLPFSRLFYVKNCDHLLAASRYHSSPSRISVLVLASRDNPRFKDYIFLVPPYGAIKRNTLDAAASEAQL